MSETPKIIRQALVIGVLSVLLGATVNFPLVKRFARGEFRETFFSQADNPGVRLITLQEAEDLWAAAETVFLDARGAGPYGEGHVLRARNFPAAASGQELPAEVLKLPRERTLVVYCEGGDCQSSLLLAKRLHDEGFKDIRVMTGGWEEWKKAGLPEEKGDDKE
ncbi:MAG: rhodanese-like domain-containing protein [Candidatus Aminicenantes bacterium]|nr:rhodanese-like domain-containing protein [Candidatus Aminicenantes bacterium]